MKILEVLEAAYGYGFGNTTVRLWSGKHIKLSFASAAGIVLVTFENPDAEVRKRRRIEGDAKKDL